MLGHELTHIRNGDVRMLVIAVIIAGVISFFAEMIFRMFFYSRGWGSSRSSGDSDRGKGGAGIAIVIAIALIAVAWFLSVVIRFALSRWREFLADAGSVELTKNPDAMISALRKIENRGELEGATSAVMEMCVDNPREGFEDLFATHPPVDKRVDALVRFAGGHDPGPLAVPQFDGAPELEQAQERAISRDRADGPFGPASPGGKPFLPEPPADRARHTGPGLAAAELVRPRPVGTTWRITLAGAPVLRAARAGPCRPVRRLRGHRRSGRLQHRDAGQVRLHGVQGDRRPARRPDRPREGPGRTGGEGRRLARRHHRQLRGLPLRAHQVRGQVHAANRAARKHGCDEPKP